MIEITNSMPNSKSWKTRLTLLLASSLTIMAATTIAPSLPAMNQHFESTIADPDLCTSLGSSFFSRQLPTLKKIAYEIYQRKGVDLEMTKKVEN
jgi:hypothetical protein